jgi:hypothetical protein
VKKGYETEKESLAPSLSTNKRSRGRLSVVEHSEAVLKKLVLKLLLRFPQPSWGTLGFRYPTLTAIISYLVLPALIVFLYPWAVLLALLFVKPFPINYVVGALLVLPLALISYSNRLQHLFRLYRLDDLREFVSDWDVDKAVNEYLAHIRKPKTE